MTHTPTPWLYRPKEYDDWGIVRASELDEDGFQRVICQASYSASPDELLQHRVHKTDPAFANAARIVACVNACDGIDNAALDAGVIAELVEAARDVLRNTYVGKPGAGVPLRSKWCSYPAKAYHNLNSTLAKLGQTP